MTDTANPPVAAVQSTLPISRSAAIECARWLMANFGSQMRVAVDGKVYRVEHLCGIVCQETASKWLRWVGTHSAETILERCVFDASGDYPGTTRSAFPRNTSAFRSKYGEALTAMLVAEANLTRRMQGWGDKPWVYKGYGLFQHDLQHVLTDEAFFRARKWRSFEDCLLRCGRELDAKLRLAKGDLSTAIERYNGSGPRARQYRRNVEALTAYCAEVTR